MRLEKGISKYFLLYTLTHTLSTGTIKLVRREIDV